MTRPHEVLGLPKDAPREAVRRRFRALARRYHPDTNGGDETAAWMFRQIKAAHDEILSNERNRLPGAEDRNRGGARTEEQEGHRGEDAAGDLQESRMRQEQLVYGAIAGIVLGAATWWAWTAIGAGAAAAAITGNGRAETWNTAAGCSSTLMVLIQLVLTDLDRQDDKITKSLRIAGATLLSGIGAATWAAISLWWAG